MTLGGSGSARAVGPALALALAPAIAFAPVLAPPEPPNPNFASKGVMISMGFPKKLLLFGVCLMEGGRDSLSASPMLS